jgi:hypothetical protein
MRPDFSESSRFDVPPWFYADLEMQVQDPDLQEIVAHWEALRDGDALPNAALIDPLNLRKHLGNLFMVRVGEEGQEFVYSLIGTRIAEILARDSTGLRVEQTFPEGHPALDLYRLIYRERRPVRTHGRLNWVNKDYKSFESVMLPLVDDTGQVVKMLGAALYFAGQ